MRNKSIIALLFIAGLFAAASASADHNSIWGAGFANMPNDIHNSAIEDDQDVFMDLVQYGNGADSVNRYDDGTDTTGMGGSSRLSASRSTLSSRAPGVGQGGARR